MTPIFEGLFLVALFAGLLAAGSLSRTVRELITGEEEDKEL